MEPLFLGEARMLDRDRDDRNGDEEEETVRFHAVRGGDHQIHASGG